MEKTALYQSGVCWLMLNALGDASAASAPARRGFAFTAVFLISACSHVPARAGLPTGTGPLSHHPATSA